MNQFHRYLWFFSSSEQCPEGIVAIAGNTLRILALEKLGAIFNQGTVYQSRDPSLTFNTWDKFILLLALGQTTIFVLFRSADILVWSNSGVEVEQKVTW